MNKKHKDYIDPEIKDCATQLKALSNPIRLQILVWLQEKPSSVKALIRRIPIEQNLMSHHLKKLRKAGLVSRRRDGKGALYSIAPEVRAEDSISLNLGGCTLCLTPDKGA